MSGLEIIGGVVISAVIYLVITGLLTIMVAIGIDCDADDIGLCIIFGYVVGMALFVIVFMMWMSGEPFPF